MKRCLGCMETYSDELNVCPHCGYVENSMPEEAIHMVPGTILHGQYTIGKVVGYGGFGVTYIAWDNVLEKRVAIKEYLPSEFSTRMPGKPQLTIFNGDKAQQFDDGMKKFLDEARRLAKFQDEPGIVKIYDCFEENSTAYIVMEYLEGVTLGEYLKENGTVPEKVAIQMLMPIMRSLKTVHAEGIIHRDIAPDNIMISTDNQIKLIDFGAARYATTSHSRSLTVIIKPGYSPEEQYRSRGDQGSHTDVYAMGAVLYKMITGKTPPDAMERRAYFENGKKDMLEPPSKYVKNLSSNTENAILNAMNVRIEDRTPDMETLIHELTTEDEVVRHNGKIKKIDILKWPLGVKIAVPTAFVAIVTLIVLFLTGVIGFDIFSPRDIYIPDGMTRVPRIVSMEETEAQSTLEEKQLQLVISGKQYDEQIGDGCVLTQEMTVGSVVPINYNLGVVISAGERTVEAPFVTGFEKESAIKYIEESELSYEIVEDYDSVIPEGYVAFQSIDGGTEVSVGTIVTLTVSLGRDPNAKYDFTEDVMPEIVGKHLDDAKELCEKQGIKLIVTEYDFSSDYDAMYVLVQGVKAGKKIQEDATVEVVLSKGKQSYIVPDVVYFTEEEAISNIKGRGLDYNISYEESENVAEGCVISQSIDAGTQAKEGDVIELVVSSGPPKFEMIDVVGDKHKDAEEKLQELGLVVTVDYVYDSDYEVGTVIEQSEKEGAKVYKGYEIVITVVSDKELIEVPNVTGKSYSEASDILKEAGLKVEKNEIYDNTVEKDIVISQTPQAGSSQKDGTKILLTVSLGKQPVTVKFDALGGDCSDSEKTVYYTETYGELPTPSMDYHTFLGWYTAEKSGTKVESNTEVVNTATQTLYARWERIYVRVGFDANGGSVGTSSANIAMGEKYSLPTPTRKYYTFDGWYTKKDGGSEVTEDDTLTNKERHTLYAHWTAKTVNVTYDAGAGEVNGSSSVKYNLGSEYGNKTASRTGYIFMGWYTKKDGNGTKILESTTVTSDSDHTLYAYWSNTASNVKFNANGGNVEVTSIKVTYDREYGTLPTPVRKGYTFEGWYTSANGGSKVTEKTVCNSTKDVTVYARWENTKYTVTFDANGGSCSTTSKTVAYVKNYGTLPTPNKTGHNFEGWYTEISGGTRINDNSTYNETSNSTLYAHWSSSKYTVYFNGNGGSCSTGSMSVTYGSAYGTLPTASKTCYRFVGWYTSASGGEYVSTATIYKDTKDITLYAHWNEIPVEEIHGIPGNKTIGVGEGLDTYASVYPGNATNRRISWSSSNNSVAQVDRNGYVSGKARGSATITAECGGIRRSFTVTVKNVKYGYDLSKGEVRFENIMYTPYIGEGQDADLHIGFITKDTVSDGQLFGSNSGNDGHIFIYIENSKLVIRSYDKSSTDQATKYYTIDKTLKANTEYTLLITPSSTWNNRDLVYNLLENGKSIISQGVSGAVNKFHSYTGGTYLPGHDGCYAPYKGPANVYLTYIYSIFITAGKSSYNQVKVTSTFNGNGIVNSASGKGIINNYSAIKKIYLEY